jgi:hypothetical protein
MEKSELIPKIFQDMVQEYSILKYVEYETSFFSRGVERGSYWRIQ